MSDKLTASEAVFGFCGWLTSREEKTIMSSNDDASVIVDLIKSYCDVNKLDEPRGDWANNLVRPKEIENARR